MSRLSHIETSHADACPNIGTPGGEYDWPVSSDPFLISF